MKGVDARVNEVVEVTSDLRVMRGKRLKESVCRYWTEDYVDQDTKEIVSIERYEVILKKGEYLDDTNIQTIMFHQQAGEVNEVTVTNQVRRGECWDGSFVPFVVKGSVDNIPRKFLLWADSCENAIACTKDFVELVGCNFYSIGEVKKLGGRILYDDESLTDEVKERCSWFQVCVELIDYDMTHDGAFAEKYTRKFLVFAYDVDSASAIANREINENYKNEKKPDEIKVSKATPFACDYLIDSDFCEAYRNPEH